MTTRVIFWSPDLSEITGQTLVTRRVAEVERNWILAVFPTGRDPRALLGIESVIKAWFAAISRQAKTAYVVCSRSVGGFLRDIPVLLLSRIGVRVVVHTHGSDLPSLFRHTLFGVLARFLYRRCELIVPSSHLIEELRQFCDRIHLCENFCYLSDLPIKNRTKCDGVTVLWNSNLMASKGVRDLVAACCHIKTNNPKLSLVLLGRALSDAEANSSEMNSWIDSLSEWDWIRVEGSVPPEKVEYHLANADVVALPSRYSSECQPLALIDAMCSGKSIIAADTPALRATLGGYPAQLCKPDVEGIVAALSNHFAKPADSKVMRAAAAQARARFAPERFDREMSAILNGNLE